MMNKISLLTSLLSLLKRHNKKSMLGLFQFNIRSNWTVLGILFIFMSPFLAAHLVYQFQHLIPLKEAHQGTLVTPPVEVTTLGLHNPLYTGKWQLIYILPKECQVQCKARLQTLNNLHRALGKDQTRVLTRTIVPIQTSHLWAEQSVWIVDPQGWLILHYPPSFQNLKGILEDMRRLLRYSHVG